MPVAWFDFAPPLRHLPRPADLQLPASAGGAEKTYSVDVDGRPVPFKFLRLGPPGRPVAALLPGMGLTPVTFWGLGPYLFPTHDLLLIDYAGLWTAARRPRGSLSLPMMARAVWKTIAAVNAKNVSFLGSSMGGGLSLLCTLDVPPGVTVHKLALFNPACYPQELPSLYKMFRFPLLGEAMTHFVPAQHLLAGLEQIGYVDKTKVPHELHASYARDLGTPAGRRVLMELTRELPADARALAPHTKRLGEIHQPVLIVWGLQDPLLAPGTGRRLAADLPHAQLLEFDNLAHMPHEESPERVGPAVGQFLAAR